LLNDNSILSFPLYLPARTVMNDIVYSIEKAQHI